MSSSGAFGKRINYTKLKPNHEERLKEEGNNENQTTVYSRLVQDETEYLF